MSNMSYCRWHNTALDLIDCVEHIGDKLSEEEDWARSHMVTIMIDVLEELGCSVELPDSCGGYVGRLIINGELPEG